MDEPNDPQQPELEALQPNVPEKVQLRYFVRVLQGVVLGTRLPATNGAFGAQT
jgi:hypothetical protein